MIPYSVGSLFAFFICRSFNLFSSHPVCRSSVVNVTATYETKQGQIHIRLTKGQMFHLKNIIYTILIINLKFLKISHIYAPSLIPIYAPSLIFKISSCVFLLHLYRISGSVPETKLFLSLEKDTSNSRALLWLILSCQKEISSNPITYGLEFFFYYYFQLVSD